MSGPAPTSAPGSDPAVTAPIAGAVGQLPSTALGTGAPPRPGEEAPALVATVDPPVSPRGAEPIVYMRDVGKKFGDFQAIQGLNLQVPQGGLVGMIGTSGCGKSTTVRLLLGVYEPSEGDIRVFGRQPHRFGRPERERVGYLPQSFVLYPTLSVDENLDFAAATYGLGRFKRRAAKAQVLELVGLTEHRKKLAGKISGGMQRRLALAATLLHGPELIFLDEPTAGIDPILREQLWGEFRRLQAAGRTQFVTTQYVAEAEYCDGVILMDAGQIVATGTPDALRQEAAGGDLIDATITNLDRPTMLALRQLQGVKSVQYRGEESVRMVVEDAAALIPQVIETTRGMGSDVTAIEERRLSFNEVFVALLERSGRDVGEVRGNVE